jgi:hypothetical protein
MDRDREDITALDDKHLHEPHDEKDLIAADTDGYVKEILPTKFEQSFHL